jgi:hypothetical protein
LVGIDQTVSLEENIDRQPLALMIALQTGGAGGRASIATAGLGPLLDSWPVMFFTVWPSSD